VSSVDRYLAEPRNPAMGTFGSFNCERTIAQGDWTRDGASSVRNNRRRINGDCASLSLVLVNDLRPGNTMGLSHEWHMCLSYTRSLFVTEHFPYKWHICFVFGSNPDRISTGLPDIQLGGGIFKSNRTHVGKVLKTRQGRFLPGHFEFITSKHWTLYNLCWC
jgi:hypothetical protein